MQLNQSRLLDLFAQGLRRSALTDPSDMLGSEQRKDAPLAGAASFLVLRKNLLRSRFPHNCMLTARKETKIWRERENSENGVKESDGNNGCKGNEEKRG
jgi:hypothetical protein